MSAENIKNKKLSLDDFKIMKCVGEGAFGEVYLAKLISNDQIYALKQIDKVFLNKQKKEHHVF